MKHNRLLRWGGYGLMAIIVGLITVACSFPFLAVNAPSGARVAVVEGWIDTTYIPDVKRLLDEGAYDTVLIVGTPRNFSYTLRIGDTVVVDLQRPVTGQLVVNACGSRDAGIAILGPSGHLFSDSVTAVCQERSVTITGPIPQLRFAPMHTGTPRPDWELLFLLYARIDGVNLHALQRSVTLHRADGSVIAGTPSFTDVAAAALVRSGLPEDRIGRLPTVMLGESRTWANAQRFAKEARTLNIQRADVISFGIHARRSRTAFGAACGGSVAIGVRCVEDPELQRGRWWRTPIGWLKVLRELAGIPMAYFMEAAP